MTVDLQHCVIGSVWKLCCACQLKIIILFPCIAETSPTLGAGSSDHFIGEGSRGRRTRRSGKGRGRGRKSGGRVKWIGRIWSYWWVHWYILKWIWFVHKWQLLGWLFKLALPWWLLFTVTCVPACMVGNTKACSPPVWLSWSRPIHQSSIEESVIYILLVHFVQMC